MNYFTGTADWHYLRKFSLTSSQTHKAFAIAIKNYKDDEAWVSAASHLYGDDWREVLNVGPVDEVQANEQEGNERNHNISKEEEEEKGAGLLRPVSIQTYTSIISSNESDELKREALIFLKDYIGFTSSNNEVDESRGDNDEIGDEQEGDESTGKIVESQQEAKIIVDNLNI